MPILMNVVFVLQASYLNACKMKIKNFPDFFFAYHMILVLTHVSSLNKMSLEAQMRIYVYVFVSIYNIQTNWFGIALLTMHILAKNPYAEPDLKMKPF